MPIRSDSIIRADDFNSLGDFPAYEAITSGDAVAMIGSGLLLLRNNIQYESVAAALGYGYNTWRAQSFVTSPTASFIEKIRIRTVESNAGGSSLVNIYIRSTLTGANLYAGALAYDSSVTHEFSVNLSTTGSETFYIIVAQRGVVSENSQYGAWYHNTTKTYTAGDTYSSTDAGTSWSVAEGNKTYWFELDERVGTQYQIVKASAAAFNARLNFVGFALSTVSAAGLVSIENMLIHNGTGYTASTNYYLSNTAGALATTPGTYERLVGRAISTTRMIRARGFVSGSLSPNGTTAPAALITSAGAGLKIGETIPSGTVKFMDFGGLI